VSSVRSVPGCYKRGKLGAAVSQPARFKSLEESGERVCRQIVLVIEVGNPEEGERQPLKGASKQQGEDCDC
jgi:hypothetical protein